jgi:poly(A) polymerase Pap1
MLGLVDDLVLQLRTIRWNVRPGQYRNTPRLWHSMPCFSSAMADSTASRTCTPSTADIITLSIIRSEMDVNVLRRWFRLRWRASGSREKFWRRMRVTAARIAMAFAYSLEGVS